ncbi:putative receptor-like protein kinase-like [Capsicum annuum]|nr:putative receptor-like protein kinase-like [Capsicum annuum]KAF3652906.1 putative receptor-like protein kinase-like [Capsicum annuum]
MTHGFKDKLGEGGFGGVYKGELSDGRTAAVKILKASKDDGDEFINEVASISQTSHVNIASILGYCVDGMTRALIYDFVLNESLKKYIYGDVSLWGLHRLYQIAVGIAKGLEYLHCGCNKRILYFNLKPHNIFLDEEFYPKISDFCLEKLCTRKESIVSILGARGTIGFIAPEVIRRTFGQVSHKFDIYSNGIMVLEMLDDDLKLHGILRKEEEETVRKMILVGLWCIQTNPTQRLSMSKIRLGANHGFLGYARARPLSENNEKKNVLHCEFHCGIPLQRVIGDRVEFLVYHDSDQKITNGSGRGYQPS